MICPIMSKVITYHPLNSMNEVMPYTENTLYEVECKKEGCAFWIKDKEYNPHWNTDSTKYIDKSHCGFRKDTNAQ